MISTRTLLKLSMWGFLMTVVFAAPSEAQSQFHENVYALERNLVATGGDRAEARLKLWEKAQHVTAKVQADLRRNGWVLLQTIAPMRRLDGEPFRLGTSVRFLIRTDLGSPLPVLKNATLVKPRAALVMRLRANGSPGRKDVGFALEEIEHVLRRSVEPNAGGAALLQRAWRQLLGDRPDDKSPLSAQATVRVPYRNRHLEFPFDVDRLDMLLSRGNSISLPRLTELDAKALRNAFELLIDPNIKSSLRRTLLRLRWRPLPYGIEDQIALDALVDGEPEPAGAPGKSVGLIDRLGG